MVIIHNPILPVKQNKDFLFQNVRIVHKIIVFLQHTVPRKQYNSGMGIAGHQKYNPVKRKENQHFSFSGVTDPALGGSVLFSSMHADNDASISASLETDLTVEAAGIYAIRLSYMKNSTSPVVRLFIDGQQIGSDIDMNNGGGMTADSADLGTFTLTAGKHVLRIESPSTNSGKWEIFLDALFFVPVG